MKTCDTCKWWGDFEGMVVCKKFSLDGSIGETYPLGKVTGSDVRIAAMGACEHVVETGPKFGCVHYEPKDIGDMAREALAEHRAGLTEEWPK